jgi:hypothetical protein
MGVTITDFDDTQDVLDWFATEHRALLAAIGHAGRHGFEPHSWRLAAMLLTPFGRLEYWHDLVDAGHSALDAADRTSDRQGSI